MTTIIVHTYLLSIIIPICFIYSYLAFRINDNDSTTTWLCNMHVVPIRASSPLLIEHRPSTWYEWSSIQQGIKPPTYIYEWLYIQQGIKPPTLYEYAWTQQLNQQQRTTSTTWQHQHYDLINTHHLIATSYNHHDNSTWACI